MGGGRGGEGEGGRGGEVLFSPHKLGDKPETILPIFSPVGIGKVSHLKITLPPGSEEVDFSA